MQVGGEEQFAAGGQQCMALAHQPHVVALNVQHALHLLRIRFRPPWRAWAGGRGTARYPDRREVDLESETSLLHDEDFGLLAIELLVLGRTALALAALQVQLRRWHLADAVAHRGQPCGVIRIAAPPAGIDLLDMKVRFGAW